MSDSTVTQLARVSIDVEEDVAAAMRALAKRNERSVAAEGRIALRRHVDAERRDDTEPAGARG